MRISVSIPKGPYFDKNLDRLKGLVHDKDVVISSNQQVFNDFCRAIDRNLYWVTNPTLVYLLANFTVVMLGNYRDLYNIDEIEKCLATKENLIRIELPEWV